MIYVAIILIILAACCIVLLYKIPMTLKQTALIFMIIIDIFIVIAALTLVYIISFETGEWLATKELPYTLLGFLITAGWIVLIATIPRLFYIPWLIRKSIELNKYYIDKALKKK